MYRCPYCEKEIELSILSDGGECSSCNEYILGGIFLPEEGIENDQEPSAVGESDKAVSIQRENPFSDRF